MKNIKVIALSLSFFLATASFAQQARVDSPQTNRKVVIVTGVRLSYQLIERWIDEYASVNPSVQIIIESRGSDDPQKYDILAEVYEHPSEIKENRAYVIAARYVIFPVANANSVFAKIYGDEGLTKQHISQIFFHDIFADKEKEKPIKAPYTVYTRMQKAGIPMVFSRHFGYEQKDIKGVGIAGADAHLVRALLKDSAGVTYLPSCVAFQQDGKPQEGLVIIPVDLNGNNKISDDEKFASQFSKVIEKLENANAGDIKNIPMDYLHLSVDKRNASPEAIDFLKWVNENGQRYLHEFGFLLPEPRRADKEKFKEFASGKGK